MNHHFEPLVPQERNITQPGSADLLASLNGLDANRDRALTNRTRRAVHDAATDLREGRHLGRPQYRNRPSYPSWLPHAAQPSHLGQH